MKDKILKELYKIKNSPPDNEAQTRFKYIDPILEELGWNELHIDVETTIKKDTENTGFFDYVLLRDFILRQPFVVVEAKKSYKFWNDLKSGLQNLTELNACDDGKEIIAASIERYGNSSIKPIYFIVTNGLQYIVSENPYFYDIPKEFKDCSVYVFSDIDLIENEIDLFVSSLNYRSASRGCGIAKLLQISLFKDVEYIGFEYEPNALKYYELLSALKSTKNYYHFTGYYNRKQSFSDSNPLESYHWVTIIPEEKKIADLERTFYLGNISNFINEYAGDKKSFNKLAEKNKKIIEIEKSIKSTKTLKNTIINFSKFEIQNNLNRWKKEFQDNILKFFSKNNKLVSGHFEKPEYHTEIFRIHGNTSLLFDDEKVAPEDIKNLKNLFRNYANILNDKFQDQKKCLIVILAKSLVFLTDFYCKEKYLCKRGKEDLLLFTDDFEEFPEHNKSKNICPLNSLIGGEADNDSHICCYFCNLNEECNKFRCFKCE